MSNLSEVIYSHRVEEEKFRDFIFNRKNLFFRSELHLFEFSRNEFNTLNYSKTLFYLHKFFFGTFSV